MKSKKGKSPAKGFPPTAEVLFPMPAGGPYTYGVPEHLADRVVPGVRVVAPLSRRVLTGIVLEVQNGAPPEGIRLKNLQEAVDEKPLLTADLLLLVDWLAGYYFCHRGEALRSVLPSVFFASGDRKISLTGAEPADTVLKALSKSQLEIRQFLKAHGGALPASSLKARFGARKSSLALRELLRQGLAVEEEYRPRLPRQKVQVMVEVSGELPGAGDLESLLERSPRQAECLELLRSLSHPVEQSLLAGRMGFSHQVVNGLVAKGLAVRRQKPVSRDPLSSIELPPYKVPRPSKAQAGVIEEIVSSLDQQKIFLLHGVTGSGKTLVYLDALKPVLEAGRQAIVLVPEIALTPQTTGRFRAVFGDRVAVLHSALSDGERYDIWRQIRTGDRYRIAVGARSAVFAPFDNLGMIIIDEEHEHTYKQSDTAARYHARQVALKRMSQAGGPVVLGSATPSLESFHKARTGTYSLLELPDRAAGRPLPEVRIHDLRRQWVRSGRSLLSGALKKEIGFALEAGGQVLLLLNRRGYSGLLICAECGHVVTCPHCMISLTVHRRISSMLCHYCGHRRQIPACCPVCAADALEPLGSGTEQVESSLREIFPERVIDRMDMDTTGGKWSHHEILERLRTGATDILVGTQMIAKGLDFPDVLLVGVVNADTGMNLPDFRATERTFQLLAQVAGRTGRGERGGEVFIQTFSTGHPAITAAVGHDYEGFAGRELKVRKSASYPPYSLLVNVIFTGENEQVVRAWALEAASFVRGLIKARDLSGRLYALGPAPCAIEKLRGRFRWHLILKSQSHAVLGRVGAYLQQKLKPPGRGACRLVLDRDPLSLM